MNDAKVEHLQTVSVSRFVVKNRILLLSCGLFFSTFCFPAHLFAQQLTGADLAPPPLTIVPKDEQKLLDDETDLKKRTVLALQMMESRVKKAEECDSRDDFQQMYNELGKFHAVMNYALSFLTRNKLGSKNLNNFKRYEMGLRVFPTRIELLRRELPIKYESYLSDLLKKIGDAREKAIEPLFGDTVVPNN